MSYHTAHSNKNAIYPTHSLTPHRLLIHMLTIHALHFVPRCNSSLSLFPGEGSYPTAANECSTTSLRKKYGFHFQSPFSKGTFSFPDKIVYKTQIYKQDKSKLPSMKQN